MSEQGGVVLRADDGTAYFIRDEILEACKLEGPYLEAAQPILNGEEAEVEGFAMTARSTTFTSVASFSGPPLGLQTGLPLDQAPKLDLGRVGRESTVMCPW